MCFRSEDLANQPHWPSQYRPRWKVITASGPLPVFRTAGRRAELAIVTFADSLLQPVQLALQTHDHLFVRFLQGQ
jgi:hypothetical protein